MQDAGAGDGGEEDDGAAPVGGDHVARAGLGDEEGARQVDVHDVTETGRGVGFRFDFGAGVRDQCLSVLASGRSRSSGVVGLLAIWDVFFGEAGRQVGLLGNPGGVDDDVNGPQILVSAVDGFGDGVLVRDVDGVELDGQDCGLVELRGRAVAQVFLDVEESDGFGTGLGECLGHVPAESTGAAVAVTMFQVNIQRGASSNSRSLLYCTTNLRAEYR